jgi:hypothetical protein
MKHIALMLALGGSRATAKARSKLKQTCDEKLEDRPIPTMSPSP